VGYNPYWQPCLLCSIILELFIVNPIFNTKCSIVYDQMPCWIELISYNNITYSKGLQCMQRNRHYTMTCSPYTTCWGSRDGAVVIALASHRCLLGSTQLHVGWVCCWFSSLFWEVFFLGYSNFPLPSKTNISKFQFDPGMHRHFLNMFLWTPWCSVGK